MNEAHPTDYLQIGVDYATVYEKGLVVQSGHSLHLANDLYRQRGAPAGLMPPAVRWMSRGATAFLLERPPFDTILRYYDGSTEAAAGNRNVEHEYSFEITMPWTQLFVSFQNPKLTKLDRAWLFCRPEPLRRETDVLHILPLPNIDPLSGELRFERIAYDYRAWFSGQRFNRMGTNIAAALGWLINYVWMSEFNKELGLPTMGVPHDLVPHNDLEPMEPVAILREMTTLDIMTTLTVDWVPARSFSDMTTMLDAEVPQQYGSSLQFIAALIKKGVEVNGP